MGAQSPGPGSQACDRRESRSPSREGIGVGVSRLERGCGPESRSGNSPPTSGRRHFARCLELVLVGFRPVACNNVLTSGVVLGISIQDGVAVRGGEAVGRNLGSQCSGQQNTTMGHQEKGRPEHRRSNSKMIVEVPSAGTKSSLGLAVLVTAGFPEAFIG